MFFKPLSSFFLSLFFILAFFHFFILETAFGEESTTSQSITPHLKDEVIRDIIRKHYEETPRVLSQHLKAYRDFSGPERYTVSETPGVVERHISWTFFLNPFVQDRGERSKGYADNYTDRGWKPFNQGPPASYEPYKHYNTNSSAFTIAQTRDNSNSTDEKTRLSLTTAVNIKSSNFYNTEGIKGLGIKFYLKSNLYYSTPSNSGKKIYTLIQTGKYRLTAALVEVNKVNGNNQCIYSSPKVKIESPLKDQKLNIEFTLDRQYTLFTGPKEFYLSLEIEAIDLPNELKPLPYEGFLHLGNDESYRTNTEHFIAPSIIDGITGIDKPCNTIYEKNQQNEFISELNPEQKLNSEEIILVLPFQFDNLVKTDLVIKQRNESASIHQWNLKLKLCLKSNKRIYNPPVHLSNYEANISTAFDQRYLERPLFKPLDEAQIIPTSPVAPHRKNLDAKGCVKFYTTLKHKFYMHDFPHLIAFKADMPYFSHYSPITFLTFPSHKVTKDEIKQVEITELPKKLGIIFDEETEEKTQNQRIKFTADKNEIRVLDKRIKSYPIDRFLNFHVKIKPTLSLEPGVHILTSYTNDATTDASIEYKNLRKGIYLLRSAFMNFYPEPSISSPLDINSLHSIAEENNHLYTFEELTYIDDQGNISQPYSFNFRDPRLSALRSHLLIQYQMINEKKMILAFYLAKIYGLIPHNEFSNKLNLDFFTPTVSRAGHDYSENLNQTEKDTLNYILNQSKELCSFKIASRANQCDRRRKALKSFLTELSKDSSDSNFDLQNQITKQHSNINSLLNDYIDCSENSFKDNKVREFCENKLKIEEALKKTLALQEGHKYQVIDNFEKVRRILRKYLGLINSGENFNELTSHIYNKDTILLILLKIIDKSFDFLALADDPFNSQNAYIIINEVKKLKNYKKLSKLLYKNSDLISPVYWTPFIPSKRYSLSHVAPIYPLSELCQKNEEDCTVIETIMNNIEYSSELSDEERRNLSEQDERIREQIASEQNQTQTSSLFNQIKQLITNLNPFSSTSEDTPSESTSTEDGITPKTEPILVNTISEAQKQNQGQDYMEFLFRKGEENQTMYDTSMCYSMLNSLAFFNLKYISLHPNGNETKEQDSILDKWCKEKISKSLNDFYSIYNRNRDSNYANNSTIDENTKRRMNRTKELIQSLGFEINDLALKDLPDITEPNDSKRFKLINDHFNLPHEDFLTSLEKKLELVTDQSTHTQTHTEPDDDTNTELDEVIINDLKEVEEDSNSKFKTHQNKIDENKRTPNDLKRFIKNMIRTFNPRLKNERARDTLNLIKNNLYLPVDFSRWNVHPNLIFSFCSLWVENVTINSTLFTTHFNGDIKKEKIKEVMLNCLESFDNLKNANNRNLDQETLANIHKTKPYIVEKQKRIFEIGAVEHELGISTILLLNSNTSVENAETIRLANATVSTQTPFLSFDTGITKSWYLSDTDRNEERSVLSVKRTILRITLKKYESCLTFFKNPHYEIWKDIRSTQDPNQDSTQNSDINYLIHLIEAMPHITMTQVPLGIEESEIINFNHMKGGGFMLCDKVSIKEEEIREHYFYIDGKLDDTTTANIAQDQNDIRNRPWSFTIRGQDTLDLFFQSIVSQSHKFRNIATQLHNLNATELPNELAKALRPLKQHYYLLSTPGVHKEWLISNENQLFEDNSVSHRALNTLYNTFFNPSPTQ